jgi:ABC-type polysaccharide/polyol phosphate export permease
MTPFITAYHDIFFDGRWPALSVWALTMTYAIGAAVAGLAVMLKHEDSFSEAL